MSELVLNNNDGDGKHDTNNTTGTTKTPATGKKAPPPSAPASPPASATSQPSAPSAKELPRFFFPGEGGRGRGRALLHDTLDQRSSEIQAQFKEYPQGMSHENFVAVTKDLCNLPSFFSTPLHQRVRLLWLEKLKKEEGEKKDKELKMNEAALKQQRDALLSEDGLVTEEMFRCFWALEIAPYDRWDRFFRLIKRPERRFIFPSDFDPFLRELLKYHPGLEFLESAPEFQDKYMRTVTARIFYSSDTSQRWRLSARDVRRSKPGLLDAFDAVDENDDINTVHQFFSYEHFYVLYCKFWELDTDRDFLLSRDDLLRYGGHALTRHTIDRVFEQAGRQFLCTTKGKMGFEDFVFFMLAEEDKTNLPAIRYWFNVVDLDSDGVIRPHEMRAFYDEQMHRMECLGHELVTFDDIYTQMCDLVGLRPLVTGGTFDEFTLLDFTRHGPDHMMLCGNFFNMLFNLNKFVAFEQRDPFLLKQQMSIAAPVAVSASLVAAEASVGSAGDLFLVLCHFLLLFSFLILASTDSTIFLVQNRS
jgi:serine/threonine-protein phosphatase 2A regulatory subunit B''